MCQVNAPGSETARASRISDLHRQAQEYRSRRAQASNKREEMEALRQEASTLLRAAALGDRAYTAHLQEMIDVLRIDTTLPQRARAYVVAMADNLKIHLRADLSVNEKRVAFEAAAREHVKLFPEVPEVYESWMRITEANSSENVPSVARMILEMPAPDAVKVSARIRLDRHSLVGRSISSLLEPWPAARKIVESANGRQMIVYSWSPRSRVSLDIARRIELASQNQAVLIGLALNALNAREASAPHPPGMQIVDPSGEVAKALLMNAPGLAYRVDEGGRIVSVVAAVEGFMPHDGASPLR